MKKYIFFKMITGIIVVSLLIRLILGPYGIEKKILLTIVDSDGLSSIIQFDSDTENTNWSRSRIMHLNDQILPNTTGKIVTIKLLTSHLDSNLIFYDYNYDNFLMIERYYFLRYNPQQCHFIQEKNG